MGRLDREAWYCPAHGLLVLAEQLVGLHASDASRTTIRELLDDSLRGLVSNARGALTRILTVHAAARS
jgi:hypothetical protein